MLKKYGLILGASAAALLLSTTGHGVAPASAAEVTLRGASCFPIGSPPSRAFEGFVKDINAKGSGVVKIDLIGGAPAIGNHLTLTQKMSRGAYDLVGCTEAYFGNVIPEAPVLRFAERSWAELRQNGGMAYVQKLLAEKNIHYLARHGDFGPFHLWLKDPIKAPNLKGLHLRVAPVYTAFFKALGATTQSSNLPQIYTYMENGTVQGYGWPAAAWVPTWTKVTGYKVEPGFYSSALHTLINKKKWDSLTNAQRDFLTKMGADIEAATEPSTSKKLAAQLAKENAMRASKGMKVITFTGADREKWLATAKKAGWDEVLQRSPKHGPELMKLFTK